MGYSGIHGQFDLICGFVYWAMAAMPIYGHRENDDPVGLPHLSGLEDVPCQLGKLKAKAPKLDTGNIQKS